ARLIGASVNLSECSACPEATSGSSDRQEPQSGSPNTSSTGRPTERSPASVIGLPSAPATWNSGAAVPTGRPAVPGGRPAVPGGRPARPAAAPSALVLLAAGAM